MLDDVGGQLGILLVVGSHKACLADAHDARLAGLSVLVRMMLILSCVFKRVCTHAPTHTHTHTRTHTHTHTPLMRVMFLFFLLFLGFVHHHATLDCGPCGFWAACKIDPF